MKVRIVMIILFLFVLSSLYLLYQESFNEEVMDLSDSNEYILENITIITMINESDVFKGSLHIKIE